jgi:dolichol-phosphate mannosyltransferase
MKPPPLEISVIMPTYNEAGNIQSLIQDVMHALVLAEAKRYEIIVVDDDSPDHTWEVAAQTPGIHADSLRVIRRMNKHGLTNSLRDGIAASRYHVVVWMDCDYSHPPEKIPQMLYMLGQGYDVVVNSRYIIGAGEERSGKGGPLQLFLSKLLNWGIRFALKPSFSDYTSGFIAVRRYVLDEFDLRGDYGEYFIDFIYRVISSQKYLICETPYMAVARRTGESKTGTNLAQYTRRGWKYLWAVVRLKLESFSASSEKPAENKNSAEPGK